MILKRVFQAMVKQGMGLGEEKLHELLAINAHALSSRAAVHLFWEKYSCQPEVLEAGLEALFAPLEEEVLLAPVPGALELLEELHGVCPLALVTMGNADLQRQKMKKAGIQPERFSTLIVGTGPSKKKDYQQVLMKLGLPASEGIVCGDRVPIDLTPAKELGLFTVHFLNGRGRVHSQPQADVDLTIHSLNQLKQVMIGKR